VTRVRDVMTHPVVTVEATVSLESAARLMLEKRVGCLPVLGGAGTVIGVLTKSDFAAKDKPVPFSTFSAPDILGHWLQAGTLERIHQTARTLTVGEVMTQPPVTVGEDASIEEVARTMLKHDVDQVPVVRDGRPVGMLARYDLLRLMLEQPQGS